MSRAADSGGREEKQFRFGLDVAPPSHPWRESRLVCAPTETSVYFGDRREPVHAQVHDISRSGMRLVLNEAIAEGTSVKVELSGMIAVGEIRYCLQRGETFEAGMRIDSTQKRV